MPSHTITAEQYGQALLDHVQKGVYPDSEDLISAELPSSALPGISTLLQQARDDLTGRIKAMSEESAPDIDGWISQAKQLRNDIWNAQILSKDIQEQALREEELEGQVNDAASKVNLLKNELVFSKSLVNALEKLHGIEQTTELIQRAIMEDRVLNAVDLSSNVESGLSALSTLRNTRFARLFELKISDLRGEVAGKLRNSWEAYIRIDRSAATLEVLQHPNNSPEANLADLAHALSKLGMLNEVLVPFGKDLDSLIISPRLQVQPGGDVVIFETNGDVLSSLGRSSDLSAQSLFSDLHSMIDFLHARLPAAVFGPLGEQVVPYIKSRLIPTWLASAIPESLDGMEDFRDTISLVRGFADTLQTYGWQGHVELTEWIHGIPNAWIRKRQEACLSQVRKLLSKGLGESETVERVETQKLSQDGETFVGNGGGDDWNAGWSDDEEEKSSVKPAGSTFTNTEVITDEEEDVSAWGLDDEKDDVRVPDDRNSVETAQDDEDAWGWGAENENESPTQHSPAARVDSQNSPRNGLQESSPKANQEITLKETYNISSLPKEICDIVLHILSDSNSLRSPEYVQSPVVSVSPSLLSLPSLILAMYRAGSTDTYALHPSGNMFMYNDSLWLAERLQNLESSQHQPTSSKNRFPNTTLLNTNLTAPIAALQSHGRRAYAKEMESQRTVITDLLDGAQGFVHCTEHPFNQECDIAIASTVDRLRQLHRSWKAILSQSALLQSLGSLLSTVCNKIIIDTEDMSDISEPESQQLTRYCSRIATLEELFRSEKPESPDSIQPNDDSVLLTAIYTPAWLKFQYLANILESSLLDIKYLWTEGELGLEFETEELVDLVLALFADSPHRRTAIGEIRAARRRRVVRL